MVSLRLRARGKARIRARNDREGVFLTSICMECNKKLTRKQWENKECHSVEHLTQRHGIFVIYVFGTNWCKVAETTILTKEGNMKRITIILLILTVFGTAAWSQMGGGMMDRSTQQLYP